MCSFDLLILFLVRMGIDFFLYFHLGFFFFVFQSHGIRCFCTFFFAFGISAFLQLKWKWVLLFFSEFISLVRWKIGN